MLNWVIDVHPEWKDLAAKVFDNDEVRSTYTPIYFTIQSYKENIPIVKEITSCLNLSTMPV